jgi:hypothetical protein
MACRAAGIAALAGRAAFMPRAIASGSIKFALPSNQIDDVNVLLPEPLGPAMTDRVGNSLKSSRKLADNAKVRLAGRSRLETDFEPPSVWEFLYIPAKMINVDD